MSFEDMTFGDALAVDGYGPGFFRIKGEVTEGAVLLTPAGFARWDGWDDLGAFSKAIEGADVVLIGSGETHAFPPAELLAILEKLDIGFEIMSTPSACRTHNVLTAERRKVTLAALPV